MQEKFEAFKEWSTTVAATFGLPWWTVPVAIVVVLAIIF